MEEFTNLTGTDLVNLITFFSKVIILFLLIIFYKPFKQILSLLIFKLKTGSHIKIASLEIETSPFFVNPKSKIKSSSVISAKEDKDNYRQEERELYYQPNRHVFLVHKIFPSENHDQLYDVLIYLIPHKDATLINIQKVEYFFGHYWDNQIFTSTDRANGFPISTSAFGHFVCTAKVYFTDGYSAIIWRYIDFEMGNINRGTC